jgi:hypothetical protein
MELDFNGLLDDTVHVSRFDGEDVEAPNPCFASPWFSYPEVTVVLRNTGVN